MNEKFKLPSREVVNRVLAAGLASAAFGGALAEAPSANAGVSPAGIEQVGGHEALNPRAVAAQVVAAANANKIPNVADAEMYLMEPGTFVNSGPVAAAESSAKHIAGTRTLKKGEYVAVQFGRRMHRDGRDWLQGFVYPNTTNQVLANSIQTEHMVWFDLKTAKFKRFAYPDPNTPGKMIAPRLLPVRQDPDANLQLVSSFNTLPGVMPPNITIASELHGTEDRVLSEFKANGLQEVASHTLPH